MKKITAILILLTLLTSCGEQRKTAENSMSGTTAENNIGEISCEVTTTCSDMISSTVTTAEIPEKSLKTTESQTTVTVSEITEEKESGDSVTTSEIPEKSPKTTKLQTTVTVSEITEEKESDDSVTTSEIPEISPETVELQTTVTVSENAEEKKSDNSVTTAETTDISPKTDYEKALEIYNFMRENGSGTCINYACRTYEMCREVGLPCYIVWTNAGMYGHVANTVKIGDIWYILDAQGGYFLDYNYGFTEVVDIDGNHIADDDMLSNYSYEELN